MDAVSFWAALWHEIAYKTSHFGIFYDDPGFGFK